MRIILAKTLPDASAKPMAYSGKCLGEMWLGLHPQFIEPTPVRAAEIISAVLAVTHVSQHDFASHRRHYQFVYARQIACWFMKHYTALSLPQIGRLIGNRDHSTVIHAIRRVNERPDLFASKVGRVASLLRVSLPNEVHLQ